MLREHFPILAQQVSGQPLTYLDNAATTQKPQAVIDAVSQYYQTTNANVHRASHHLSAEATLRFEQAREKLANYLNAASSREIVWTRGTTEAINLVANSWGQSNLKPGDEIILSTLEHHANIVPWQMVAERTGAVIKVIPLLENGDLDLDAYRNLLGERTKLIAVGHTSNTLGTINPVKEITAAAKAVGATVLIDGAQALPHFTVDVRDLGCDFYVFSGHKMFAPTGIGVLWGLESMLEAMPPWQGGGEMIAQVSFSGTSYNQLPFKFEAGTPNIAGVLGLSAAVDWLSLQNRAALDSHEQALFQHALECCSTIPGFIRIGAPDKSVSLVSFQLDQHHQQDIGLQLDQMGIAVRTGHHCAMPLMQALGLNGTTRASFAFYNTLEEVERFATALDQIAREDQIQVPVAAVEEDDPAFSQSPYGTKISAADLLAKLGQMKDWNSRYRELMLLGKQLPKLADKFKSDDNRVQGCESQTWLTYKKDSNGIYHFLADSDARVIRGLIALVLAAFNHKSAEEINAFDINNYFDQLDLQRHLSPSRGNGLRAIVEKIRQIAADAN